MFHGLNVVTHLVFLIVIVFYVSTAVATNKGFARGESLISAQELKTLMETHHGDLLVVAVAENSVYRAGHIPGAQRVWREDYSAIQGMDYPYPGRIARKTDFRAFARILGVNDDTTFVVYDHKFDATRLWWAFYLYGKTDVRVLDGGYFAWKAAGLPIETNTPPPRRTGGFKGAEPVRDWSVDSEYVKRGINEGQIQLWDTRDENEWLGKVQLTGASRKGRIPSAQYWNWSSVRSSSGEFSNATTLTKLVNQLKVERSKNQVFYCHSGIRATQVIFALYLLGWPISNLHNFDGSWIAWTHDKNNPTVCEACER